MALTPITSLTLATGESKNVTVVDQNGVALPDSSITFGETGPVAVSFMPDLMLGGFTVTGVLVGVENLQAVHTPSGHTATLPITVTNPVTAISFATNP